MTRVWSDTETMLVSKGYATARAILIWVVCVATWGHGDAWPRPLPRAMFGSVALHQLGSGVMSRTLQIPRV